MAIKAEGEMSLVERVAELNSRFVELVVGARAVMVS
jgi:hypothetical protein